ncbi:mucin, partial [Thraustotheca clavata]
TSAPAPVTDTPPASPSPNPSPAPASPSPAPVTDTPASPSPNPSPAPSPSSQTPNTDVPTPSSSAPTPSSSAPTPSSSAPTPSSPEPPTPSSSAPTPSSSAPTPSSSAPTPSSPEPPTPSSSAPTPSSSAPTPSSPEPPTPSSSAPTPSSSAPIPSSPEPPTPSSSAPTPSSSAPIPSSPEPPTPSSLAPTPSSEAPTPSSSSPGSVTSIPTEIPLIVSQAPVTNSPILSALIADTMTPSLTPSPISNLLLANTPAPSTVAAVVTASPEDVSKLAKLNNLGATPAPSSGSGSGSSTGQAAANNNHSDLKNRAKGDPTGSAAAALKAESTTGTESSTQQTIRYIVSSIIGLTVALMAFFLFQATNPSYITPDETSARALAPNTWELPLFIGLLQQLSALSLENYAKVPQAFYVNFLDSLSWLNFLIHGSASTSTTSSMTSLQLSGTRRLSSLSSSYDATGFLQFSLRSNVSENDWFVRIWTAFIIVIAILLLAVVATGLYGRWSASRSNPFNTNSTDSQRRSTNFRSISYRLLGMCVLVVYFAILPMSMICMFEILEDATTSGFPHLTSILAILTLLITYGVIGFGIFKLANETEASLSRWATRAVFGVLYSNFHYSSRLFFGATAITQGLTGILLASITANSLTQLLVLIIVHMIYLLSMVIIRPFTCMIQSGFSIAMEVILLLIFAISCGMTGDITVDSQINMSYAIVIIICLFCVVMFVRQLVMLWTFASAWAKDEDEHTSRVQTFNEREPDSDYDYNLSIPRSGHSSSDNNTRSSPLNTIRIMDTARL